MLGVFKKRLEKFSAVGIDFQPDGVAIAVKRRNAGGNRAVLQCDFAPIDGPENIDIVLENLADKYKLKNLPAVIVLPASQYSLLQASSPPMEIEQLRASVRWKIGELISYPVEDAVVDVFEYPEAGQRGSERKLYIVAARSDDIQNAAEQAQRAELNLKSIDIGEMALRNVISRFEHNDPGVIVLSFNEHGGLLEFIKQDEVYLVRRLEFGFSHLLDPNNQHTGDELVLELQRSLDYFESQFAQPLPTKLLIFPPDKFSGELMMHLSSHLNLEVEPLVLDALEGFTLECEEESQARCLLAVGAALRDNVQSIS